MAAAGKAKQSISGHPSCASAPVLVGVSPQQETLCPAGSCFSNTGIKLTLDPFRSWTLMILGGPFQLRVSCELLLVHAYKGAGDL